MKPLPSGIYAIVDGDRLGLAARTELRPPVNLLRAYAEAAAQAGAIAVQLRLKHLPLGHPTRLTALNAVRRALAGQIPLAMVDLPSALQQIKAGKLVAFGVTSAQRLPMLPDMPTFAEAGVPGYESTGWFGVVAPAGTPPAIVTRLNTELVAALNDPEIRNAMRNLGVEPAPMKVEEFEQYIKSEIQKWGKVIKTAGTKLE